MKLGSFIPLLGLIIGKMWSGITWGSKLLILPQEIIQECVREIKYREYFVKAEYALSRSAGRTNTDIVCKIGSLLKENVVRKTV